MHIFLVIICGLIIGHLIKKCNRLEAENQRLKSMLPPTPKIDIPRQDLPGLRRYDPVIRRAIDRFDDEPFMMRSPNGEYVRWQDVAKPQPTGGRLIKEPRP